MTQPGFIPPAQLPETAVQVMNHKAALSPRTCPHDSSHHLILSGTKVREKLRSGEQLPAKFSRPEVAEVLRKAYTRSSATFEIKYALWR